MTMSELSKSFVRRYKRFRTRSNTLRGEMEEAKARLERLHCPGFIEGLIKPIANGLDKKFPDRDVQILGPFGLCSETAIHLYKKGVAEKDLFGDPRNCLSITFIPGCLEQGELFIRDYNKDTKEYPTEFIGEMNGMNHPSIRIPTNAGIPWLARHVR